MSEAVKYGYGYGMQPGDVPAHADFLGFIEKVEKAGFDSFWLDDHIAFRGNFLESLAALAAAAARTERITLGSLVYLLPLRRPAIAAKAAATVDFLSGGGRFIFGVGVGGEEAREFEVCGVSRAERGARTDEAIEILRKLWSGEAVSHEGRFFRFSDARQSPAPLSPGGPPIWVGGRSEAAQRRAALSADGYAPYLFSPARYEKALEQVRRLAAGAGRALDDSLQGLDSTSEATRGGQRLGKGQPRLHRPGVLLHHAAEYVDGVIAATQPQIKPAQRVLQPDVGGTGGAIDGTLEVLDCLLGKPA